MWPDTIQQGGSKCYRANDVSRMSCYPSGTQIDNVFAPRNENDVVCLVTRAAAQGKRIAVCGTKHSMGGHSICADGYLLDMRSLRHMRYDKDAGAVHCGPGCLWADLIFYLNTFGKSVRTMQSYCTFSVGGSLSVNAHGITTDHCFAESVVAFRVVTVDEAHNVAVQTCTPVDELFGLVLGGYGLFGIIVDVTLRVADNAQLEMDAFMMEDPAEFERVYENIRADSDVDIKLARLNILNLKEVSMYVFRRSSHGSPSQGLGLEPRRISWQSQLLYKWAMPAMKELRYALEKASGQALDWSSEDGVGRNELLFESAVPLSKLYEPMIHVDDTFVLQEYFVPKAMYSAWVRDAAPIYADLAAERELMLLNTTIRFVEYDARSFLKYAAAKDGSFAFVLYYRLRRGPEMDRLLGAYHGRFVAVTLVLGGTFYLPYRRVYTPEELQKAYPMVNEFARLKEKYDPTAMFSNMWFEHYIRPRCSREYQDRCAASPRASAPRARPGPACAPAPGAYVLPRAGDPQLVRRTDSYRALWRDKYMSARFRDQFLVRIFNVADNKEVMRVIGKAAWDPQNATDLDIFRCLARHFAGAAQGAGGAMRAWKQLRQLSHQRQEIAEETCSLLAKAGKLGHVRRYCSIGDHGKIVLPLRQAIERHIGTAPADAGLTNIEDVWVLHNAEAQGLPELLERGHLDPVGKYVYFDYCADPTMGVPSGVCDLVTMHQGLHHIPVDKLPAFLREVERILRPGGVFMFREHDLRLPGGDGQAPYPMLDLAHSVLNALTGVSEEAEAAEVRAFRPISEWREIVQQVAGLEDCMCYEMEAGDPTVDEMLCFVKPDGGAPPPAPADVTYGTPPIPTPLVPPILNVLRGLLGQVPGALASTTASVVDWLVEMLPTLLEQLVGLLRSLDMGEAFAETLGAIEGAMKQVEAMLLKTLKTWQSMFSNVELKEAWNMKGLLEFPELFLLVPYLQRKEAKSAVEQHVLKLFREWAPQFLLAEDGTLVRQISTQPPADPTGEPREADQPPQPSGCVTSAEVYARLQLLVERMPALADPERALHSSGFSVRQQSALVGKFGGTDMAAFAENLAWYVENDRGVWSTMTGILETVEARGDLPTKKRLLHEQAHPWHRLLRAFFRSSRVRFDGTVARMGLRAMDLTELVTIWEEEQRQLRESKGVRKAAAQAATPVEVIRPSQDVSSIEGLMQLQAATGPQVTVTLEAPESGVFTVPDVGEVISAKFGYVSLTSRLSDVTAQVRQHFKVGTTLRIPLETLQHWRHEVVGEAIDVARRALFGAATLGVGGHAEFELTYRRAAKAQSHGAVDVDLRSTLASRLSEALQATNVIQRALHADDGEYTWFKLSEWMQVEILDILAQFLQHTPWFRFPFVPMLRLYFDVLSQQAEIVRQKYGFRKAYASMAFLTDVIPGFVMALIFGQMALLAQPLLMQQPDGYDGHDQERLLEEIVLRMPEPQDTNESRRFWARLDQRIHRVKIIEGSTVVVLVVPPFKALGEILHRLAAACKRAEVLEISNQKEVQVRVSARVDDVEKVNGGIQRAVPGVQLRVSYQFPAARKHPGPDSVQQLAYQVPCLCLLHFLQTVDQLPACTFEQVYDFWN